MRTWLRMATGALAILMMAVLAAALPAQQLPEKKVLTLEAAKKMAEASEKEAMKNHWTQVIAILDDGGNLIYLERMDNTQVGSIDIALAKARSALYFQRPTKVFQEAVAKGGMNILKLPNAIANEGGVPLRVDGQIVGSIGISGATAEQDGVTAAAGVAALAKMVSP
jgi:glc operon protein GlcG